MLPALKTILIIFGWISTGLITASMLKWKLEELKENKWNMIYFGIFLFLVAMDIVINFFGSPQIFSPGLAVYMVGNLFRYEEWPNDPKFTEYHKIYILILATGLTSSLVLITFSDLAYASMGLIVIPDFMGNAIASMIPLIMPLIIILGSDPTNRYGTREPNRIIGGLLALMGVIL